MKTAGKQSEHEAGTKTIRHRTRENEQLKCTGITRGNEGQKFQNHTGKQKTGADNETDNQTDNTEVSEREYTE